MTVDLGALRADLAAEHAALDAIVAALEPAAWATPTPAEGWDVRDSISHLCYFDETATLAVTDPEGFAAHVAELTSGAAGTPDVDLGRSLDPPALLARWRSSRTRLLEALGGLAPGARVPWYGPAMGAASFITARLMETWAHGVDVTDALGRPPVVSARLRHVCDIGIRARPYAFAVHGVDDPGDPVRIEVTAPGGGTWTWGPPGVPDRIVGTALDLAAVLTQRRHPDDTALEVHGPVASLWISVAQAFAGPAGPGRRPGLGRLVQEA